MGGYHKDEKTGNWHCDKCNEVVPIEVLMRPYDYFGKSKEKGHICKVTE